MPKAYRKRCRCPAGHDPYPLPTKRESYCAWVLTTLGKFDNIRPPETSVFEYSGHSGPKATPEPNQPEIRRSKRIGAMGEDANLPSPPQSPATLKPRRQRNRAEAKDTLVSKGKLSGILRLRNRGRYRPHKDRIAVFRDDPRCPGLGDSETSVHCLDCPPGTKRERALDKRGKAYDYNWHKHKANHRAGRLATFFNTTDWLREWLEDSSIDFDLSTTTFIKRLCDENGEKFTEKVKEDLKILLEQLKLLEEREAKKSGIESRPIIMR